MSEQIGNPETGEFVPYDEAYIAEQAARRVAPYEEVYYIPAGRVVEFHDEFGNIIHRCGSFKSPVSCIDFLHYCGLFCHAGLAAHEGRGMWEVAILILITGGMGTSLMARI